MNTMKSLTRLMFRVYSTVKNPGVQGRLSLLQETEPDINLDDINEFEDMDDLESDLMQVDKSHKQYEREIGLGKEKLKMQITARKYLKEVQPNFLTFAEKEQIRFLHEKDPVEWTLEKLSESFPALPETVYRIIRAKWSPKSVDKVVHYDKVVIENWDKFKKGELVVTPKLNQHLKKFIDRKIQVTSRKKIAEKIVPPKFTFPKPKSELFSNIIKNYLQENPTKQQDSKRVNERKSLAVANDKSKQRNEKMCPSQSAIVSINDSHDDKEHDGSDRVCSLTKLTEESRVMNVDARTTLNSKVPSEPSSEKELLTADEFIKQELDHTTKKLSIKKRIMMDVSRKQIESDIMNNISTCVPSNELNELDTDKVEQTSTIDIAENSFNNNIEISMNTFKPVPIPQREFSDNMPDTYVKEWYKKEVEKDYPDYIKIPKNKFKHGMTYRIKDCYYDDDGEFLYRVPGLKD